MYGSVIGNASTGNGVHGIYLHNAQFVAVTGNVCDDNIVSPSGGALAMDSKNVAVSGNVFVHNTYGIKFQGMNAGPGQHAVGDNVIYGSVTADYYFDALGYPETVLRLNGLGSPENVVSAPIGSQYMRTDGGAGTVLYVKETAPTIKTGWIAK